MLFGNMCPVKKFGIHIRAGVHTGECEVMGDGLDGIAFHIGARIGVWRRLTSVGLEL
jgi:hypothetical protein